MNGNSHDIIIKACRTDKSIVGNYTYNYYDIKSIVARNCSKYCPFKE